MHLPLLVLAEIQCLTVSLVCIIIDGLVIIQPHLETFGIHYNIKLKLSELQIILIVDHLNKICFPSILKILRLTIHHFIQG